MAKVVGDIAVQVGADVSKLQAGMAKGSRSVRGFEKNAAKMGATYVKVGAAVGVAAIGIAAGVAKMASSAGSAAREIKNLSDISGVGVEKFQTLAAASQSVGLSQEKLADIFKDVNDKFGDFMANGAGPLKDFFDNIAPAVGVTAEQFAKLSGPEALQLYATSLERAGLSQQQMTFYMEALASDATALLPLLRDNGREMGRLGAAAQEAGRIISADAITAGVEMERKLQELSDTLKTQATAAILEYSDEIIAAADFITGTMLPAIDSFITGIADFAKSMEPAIDALTRFIGLAQAAAGVSVGPGAAPSLEDQARYDKDYKAQEGENGGTSTGLYYVDEKGNVQSYGADTPSIPSITAPAVKPSVPLVNKSGSKKKRGGGGSRDQGPTSEDLEALQAQFALEDEIVETAYQDALAKLEEYRNAKLGTEEEYNDLEARIKADHEQKLLEIERSAQAQRLQAFSGAFGDLSSLMQTENKKLFKIGQAAAIAEATVSGYSAAVAAWDKGMKVGGPPVAAAFTAASLVKTGAMISSIASASPSGGSAAASSAGAVSATPAPSVQNVTEVKFLSGQFVSTDMIADMMNEAADRGQLARFVQR